MTLVICDPVPFTQLGDVCQSDCTKQAPAAGSDLPVPRVVHICILSHNYNWSNLILIALIKWH